MGFRNPITSVSTVDSRLNPAGAGVRVYTDNSVPATPRGVVEFSDGFLGDVDAMLFQHAEANTRAQNASQSGGITLAGGSYNGGAAPTLDLKTVSTGPGTSQSVARLSGAQVLDLGPIAKLRATAVQNVATGSVFTTINFSAAGVDLDTYSGFNAATPSRWTAPAAALYGVVGRVAVNTVNVGNSATCRLLVNGAAVQGSVGDILRQSTADSLIPSTELQLLQLNAGDYVELQGFVLTQAWATRVTTSDGVASTLTVIRIG